MRGVGTGCLGTSADTVSDDVGVLSRFSVAEVVWRLEEGRGRSREKFMLAATRQVAAADRVRGG